MQINCCVTGSVTGLSRIESALAHHQRLTDSDITVYQPWLAELAQRVIRAAPPAFKAALTFVMEQHSLTVRN